MKNQKIIFFFIVFTIILGCKRTIIDNKNNSNLKKLELDDSNILKESCLFDSLDSAQLLKVSDYLIVKQSESCIYSYLDKLKSLKMNDSLAYIKYEKLKNIYCKTNNSDVKLSFDTLMLELFANDYINMSNYLYIKGNTNELITPLVNSLSINIADSNNPTKMRQEIYEIIINKSSNQEIKFFFLEIYNKLDPEKYKD